MNPNEFLMLTWSLFGFAMWFSGVFLLNCIDFCKRGGQKKLNLLLFLICLLWSLFGFCVTL